MYTMFAGDIKCIGNASTYLVNKGMAWACPSFGDTE